MERYYNENPQVTYWRNKYEKVVSDWDNMVDDYNSMVDKIEKYECDFDDFIEGRKRLWGILDDYRNKIESFNTLPWYKKMFYKFDTIWKDKR